jgi:hypothetical protein
MPAGSFVNGGWVFVGLGPDSDYVDHVAAKPELLAVYAARIPALAGDRVLFAPVLFPVSSVPPPGDYDEIFSEVASYDDGFAKIVHSAQQTTGMPIGLESNQTAQGPAPPAVRDSGIQLGWDDEQLLIWKNRQIESGTRRAVSGVCAAIAWMCASWATPTATLMQVEGDLAVADAIGHYEGELNVRSRRSSTTRRRRD